MIVDLKRLEYVYTLPLCSTPEEPLCLLYTLKKSCVREYIILI